LHSQRGLSQESQALLLKLMTEANPGAKRLKGESPAGTLVADKTATGGARHGITSATNDIGIITLPDGRHLAVAAFVSDSAANEETRDAIIARLAKAAWDRAQSLGRSGAGSGWLSTWWSAPWRPRRSIWLNSFSQQTVTR
jgi:beta-lactamase class A